MSYLPYRINKIEIIDEDSLEFFKKDDSIKIKREDIKYVFLGLIKEEVKGTDFKGSKIRKMLRGMITGQKEQEYGKVKNFREQFLLDIVVNSDKDWYIFRIDPSSFHYKNIVHHLQYTSIVNFKQLLERLQELLPSAYFNNQVRLLLENKKLNMQGFASNMAFQEYVKKKVKELELLKSQEQSGVEEGQETQESESIPETEPQGEEI